MKRSLSAEIERHTLQCRMLLEALRAYLPDAYVGGQNSIYYQQTKPPRFVVPDLYVVLGRSPEARPCYVVWEEDKQFPDFILELTSADTEHQDRGRKLILYRDVFRTSEYFLYAPGIQRLSGFRLQDNDYVSILLNERGELFSQRLGLGLKSEGGWLHWVDEKGQKLAVSAHMDAEQRALEAERKLQEALAELERLRGNG
ncbi:MAG: Uma2 family endonuclease [Candidatus Eremiobacteraeota bacterium]|nr:Uma2 family endonuclease [Candidatus Eremiobacteraeota bacterium]